MLIFARQLYRDLQVVRRSKRSNTGPIIGHSPEWGIRLAPIQLRRLCAGVRRRYSEGSIYPCAIRQVGAGTKGNGRTIVRYSGARLAAGWRVLKSAQRYADMCTNLQNQQPDENKS